MSAIATPKTDRHYFAQSTFRKFTLHEYHRMIESGVLASGEPYELLEGNLVRKMSRGSSHDAIIQFLTKLFVRLLPQNWDVRVQCAVTLADASEPEPDFAFVRGDDSTFRTRHPAPDEIGLVVEVSDSSLLIDRDDKGRIYASNAIPVYWVVNVVDRVVEVYTQPTGTGDNAAYTHREDYATGSDVPVVLNGNTIGSIAVSQVFG
jgi:Uma2 family endonuclease